MPSSALTTPCRPSISSEAAVASPTPVISAIAASTSPTARFNAVSPGVRRSVAAPTPWTATRPEAPWNSAYVPSAVSSTRCSPSASSRAIMARGSALKRIGKTV